MNTSLGTYASAVFFIIALAVVMVAFGPGVSKVLAVVALALYAILDLGETTQYPASARVYNTGRMVGLALLLAAVIFWILFAHPIR